MTRHMDAVSLTEHQRVLSMASGFADRAEQAEAAIQRVRRVPEVRDHWRGCDYEDGWNFCLETVINALDGGAE